jgi:hypothetical protein
MAYPPTLSWGRWKGRRDVEFTRVGTSSSPEGGDWSREAVPVRCGRGERPPWLILGERQRLLGQRRLGTRGR